MNLKSHELQIMFNFIENWSDITIHTLLTNHINMKRYKVTLTQFITHNLQTNQLLLKIGKKIDKTEL